MAFLFAFCCVVAPLHCQILNSWPFPTSLCNVQTWARGSSLKQKVVTESCVIPDSIICTLYHPKCQLEEYQKKVFYLNSEELFRCKGGRCRSRYSFRRQTFTLFLSVRPVAGLRSLKTFFPRCSTISYGPRYRAWNLSPFLPSLALFRRRTRLPGFKFCSNNKLSNWGLRFMLSCTCS